MVQFAVLIKSGSRRDIRVDCLVVEGDRPAHISKHGVDIQEVLEVVGGDYVYIRAKDERWQLIGKTDRGRFLTVILGERRQKNTYGLVTARPVSRKERSFYKEIVGEGGNGYAKS